MKASITGISAGFLNLLETALSPHRIRVTGQFPNAPRPIPLERGVVTVGVQDIEAAPLSMADYLGQDAQGREIIGRALDATVCMRVCVPAARTASACQEIFERICDALLFSDQVPELLRVWCGSVKYDRELGGLTLPCYAKARVQLQREDGGTAFHDFSLRRVNQ